MKKLAKYIVSVAVLLNAYQLVAWLYAYNTNSDHQSRIDGFLKFFPAIANPLTITLVGLLLTIASVIFLLLFRMAFSKTVYSALLIVQILFLALDIWQLL